MDFAPNNEGAFAFRSAEDTIINGLLIRLMRIEFGQKDHLMPGLVLKNSELLKQSLGRAFHRTILG